MYLIIGASGFIGSHLYDYCIAQKIDVLGTCYRHRYCKDWVPFDICTDDLSRLIYGNHDGSDMDAVIICSANSSMDDCKKDEKASYDLNVAGIQRIIGQAEAMGIRCVFLSSEAVFDGKRGMYAEEDMPNPLTVYGKQKLQIEQYMMHNVTNYLIFRISRAVGSTYGEKDIFHEFYQKIIHHDEIVCLKDQSFCLTEIGDIVQVIIKALENGLRGLYHLAAGNYISRYALADLYIKKVFGEYDKVFEKEYADMSFLDHRHILGGLKGEKLADILDIRYMKTDEILDAYYDTYKNANAMNIYGE